MSENNADQLELLNSIMGELEDATAKTSSSSENDAIGTCYLSNGSFTARFFFDHNKKLFSEGWVYTGETTATNDKGEKYQKKIRCVTPKDNPLKPLSDLINDWHYNAKYTAVIFADVIEVDLSDKSQEKYFKKGLCRIVVNKKFLSALLESIKYLAKKNPSEAVAAIDYDKEGYAFQVKVEKGTQGSVSFTPDLLGEKHSLTDEQKKLVKDVSDCEWILPKEGPKNDANIALMEEYFKQVLANKNEYVNPDEKKEEAPASETESVAEEVIKDAPKKDAKKEEAHVETPEEKVARLEAALAAAKGA